MSLVQCVLWFLVRLLKILYLPFTWYSSLKPITKCPPVRNELLLMSAVSLVEKIKSKEVTVEKVVLSYMERIKEVNPLVNAVVEDRFEEALLEAKLLDKELGERDADAFRTKPLLGVPFTVKESLSVQGLPRRAGSLLFDDVRCLKDAEVVSLLRRSGAIPLLVSNTPELCMNWETTNNVTGRTNNPYDVRRTCGGSSGGEAALLGAGASLIGLGSDVGGSLRLPPHFCGVWGHKPTPGLVSDEGHFPHSTDRKRWRDVFTVGPLCRYAADLPLLLHAISNEDERRNLKLLEPIDLKSVKIYYMDGNGGSILTSKVDGEIVGKMERFVDYLKTVCDVDCQKVRVEEMKRSHVALLSLLHVKGVVTVVKGGQSPALEFLKYLFCLSGSTFVPILYAFGQPIIRAITPKGVMRDARHSLGALKNKLLDLLREDGVFLYPNFPTAAHYHNEIYHRVFDTSYLAIFNELGFPVTSCTLGLKSDGLPVGMQVVSAPYNDRLCVRVAQEVEKFFGGWQQPL